MEYLPHIILYLIIGGITAKFLFNFRKNRISKLYNEGGKFVVISIAIAAIIAWPAAIYLTVLNVFFRESDKAPQGEIMLIVLIFILSFSISPTDTTDKDRFHRSGMRLLTDNQTGLQYLSRGLCGSVAPRLDNNGNHMGGKNNE